MKYLMKIGGKYISETFKMSTQYHSRNILSNLQFKHKRVETFTIKYILKLIVIIAFIFTDKA